MAYMTFSRAHGSLANTLLSGHDNECAITAITVSITVPLWVLYNKKKVIITQQVNETTSRKRFEIKVHPMKSRSVV